MTEEDVKWTVSPASLHFIHHRYGLSFGHVSPTERSHLPAYIIHSRRGMREVDRTVSDSVTRNRVPEETGND